MPAAAMLRTEKRQSLMGTFLNSCCVSYCVDCFLHTTLMLFGVVATYLEIAALQTLRAHLYSAWTISDVFVRKVVFHDSLQLVWYKVNNWCVAGWLPILHWSKIQQELWRFRTIVRLTVMQGVTRDDTIAGQLGAPRQNPNIKLEHI